MTRTLLRGGYVHTPADPHATALCLESGSVVWTGDDDASAHFADGADRIIELEGRLVTPAFVDAHAHLAQTGLAAMGVDLSGTDSVMDALDLLAVRARGSSLAVVLGHGWDETRWPDARPFTREQVDRAVDGRPAYLSRVDQHSSVVSGALLEAAERVGDRPVSELEGYDPSGFLTRAAHHAVRDAVRHLLSAADQQAAIEYALRQAARMGLGMVHELGAPHISSPADFRRITDLRETNPLPEVVGYWGELGALDTAIALGCAGAAGDLCADGAIGSRTAAMLDVYADAPTSGHLYLTAEQVAEHVVACTKAGLQAGFHCIGDRAVAEIAEGFRRAAQVVGRQAVVATRHRLEHAEMASEEDMATFGELGLVASMQPMFDGLWGGPDSLYAQRLGVDRAAPMNAFASMNRHGVALAFGSDTPVTPFDPWAGVRAAAWHHTESEQLSVRAAFNAYTRGGWRAARRDEGGVIAPGAPASVAVWDVPGDLVVQTPDARVAAWSTDPRAGVPHLPDLHPDLDLPACVATFVHGEVAFEQPGVWK